MPLPLFLAFALQNPDVTAKAIDKYSAPGRVDIAQLQSSVADFAIQALNCYHHSARFRGVDIIGGPWPEQAKFGAQGSVVLRVYLTGGLSGSNYEMILAAMAKPDSYRAFVINENTAIPYSKNCELEHWVSAQ